MNPYDTAQRLSVTHVNLVPLWGKKMRLLVLLLFSDYALLLPESTALKIRAQRSVLFQVQSP